MNDIDKWCAKQSKVTLHGHEFVIYETALGDKIYAEWTIKDPRCREIVRERFWLNTNRAGNSTALMDGNYWSCSSSNNDVRRGLKPSYRGKSPAEAEIACITAIWEARDE